MNYNPEHLRFDKKIELQLFRICNEILTNIIKHSNSSEIDINITFTLNKLSISINYNGNGINDEDVKTILKTSEGLGLKSIYGRIQVLKGIINYFVTNTSENGVLISIPVQIQGDVKQN